MSFFINKGHKVLIVSTVLIHCIVVISLWTKKSYAEKQLIPLPAFSTNPNEGETYGMIPVWLLLDDSHKIKGMFAPSLTYNGIYGVTGTLRLFGYPASGKRFKIIAGRSTENDQTLKFLYIDPYLIDDLLRLETEIKYINDISYRFYGIGPNTKEEDESNYTHNELRWYGRITTLLSDKLSLSFQERISRVLVKPGGVDSLPYSKDMFPDVAGMDRSFTWSHKAAIIFDTRDDPRQPTEGTYAGISTELAKKVLSTDSSFLNYGIEVKHLIPFRDKRCVLILRGLFNKLDGHDDVPFYERSKLGGEDTLRGYGANRFFDNNRVLFSAESRLHLFSLNIFNVTSEWEAAPFVEVGRVFDFYNLPLFKEFKLVSGVGMRAVVRPNVVGRVDIGIGSEGVKVFVGLGYPF